jgi:hypothetical protein
MTHWAVAGAAARLAYRTGAGPLHSAARLMNTDSREG